MDPLRSPASAINRDAGAHKVTGDPVELEAARRAAEETWNTFAYYEVRYGERGKRFGFSDAGWLVTLCDRSKAEAREQVHWLAVVLSSRGMPSIMLEQHLDVLHRYLAAALPERRDRYEVLRSCAKQLRQERRSKLSDAQTKKLAALMPDRPIQGLGTLLAAAVADEANGTARAVSSMEEWLCSRDRFPADWIERVVQTIAAGRAAVSARS